MNYEELLKAKCGEKNYQKLLALKNSSLMDFVARYVALCNPDRVFISNDSEGDIRYIREETIRTGEEKKLAIEGHTVHFDGYYDQARDKKRTKFLIPKEVDLGPDLNTIDKEEGLREIQAIMKNIMAGHQLYIRFFCLGPTNSEFSIPCVQLTDSAYVAHSEDLLYRWGYEEFKRQGKGAPFFKFVHGEGPLDEGKVSKNIEKRRIYIDNEDGTVYSVNTQYGGNTIGLKKLAMRLAIYRASKEGWLTEHMFVMGVHGSNNRVTYFTGAFPSLCGKTSTAMVTGESIVGDDIAYLRKKNGKVYTVNVESGMFGIIMGINSKDDSEIWKVLHAPNEIIFSNVLIGEDNRPYWIGMGEEIPKKGQNHSGEWWAGKKDAEGNEITPSHRNARFTIDLRNLKNIDPRIDDPKGVELGGIIYGGRDSDTWVPVEESFDWKHGVITKGASLESETTAATLGEEGVRKFNPMSNLDFLSLPIGEYIKNHLNFSASLRNPPHIFSVNYFLKDEDGEYLNAVKDKRIWLKWMERRVHNEVGVIKTPTGYIPKYKDLKRLFKKILDKDYSKEDYIKQFTLRVPESLAKIKRIVEIYRTKVPDTPDNLFKVLEEERKRLEAARAEHGDYIAP
ncbi:phosphoenolpyruvate carboxykinase (GTP), partial [bacterium]|nr:phosphoenolpyruvate carboxykinase (GTP) [bacterium]